MEKWTLHIHECYDSYHGLSDCLYTCMVWEDGAFSVNGKTNDIMLRFPYSTMVEEM